MTRDYKKDFIDSVNTAKAKIVEAKETNLKIQKAAEKTYKKVVTKEFVNQIHDAIGTIKKHLKHVEVSLKLTDLTPDFEGRSYVNVYFNRKGASAFDVIGIYVDFYSDMATMCSDLHILERKNDLGDMENNNAVDFPNDRGRKNLNDSDIKEIHEQFIRGMYELAKEFK